jgi:glycine/D-amino acid oxidase-like deaminating enzyme
VVATGFDIDKFLPERVMDLHSTYALVTEPVASLPGWPAGQPLIWETRQPYIYLRTTAEGRILIGGYDEPFQDPAKRDALLPRKRGLLLRRLRQLFPDLAAVEAAWSWCGTFGETKDGLPYIGRHPSRPRCWFALGYGGNGITYSVLAARLFHQRLRGEPDLEREKLYGFGRG